MKNFIRFTFFAALITFTLTGCATRKSTQSRVNALEAQMGVVTDELARLDQLLQETRGALAGSGGAYAPSDNNSLNTAIYRTPSGFELPSADIQKALKGAGYYQGTLDGKVGPGTKEAIKAFQRDNGLEADGVCGQRTWDKLKVYLA